MSSPSSSSSPKKTLAIFGATGHQGRALITHILSDPFLSSQYSIRALTRDTTSPQSQSLLKSYPSISLTPADVTLPSTLTSALSKVHTVFAMTNPSFGPTSFEDELQQAKNIADASLQAQIQHLIFSTLPSVTQISSGKYTKCTPFDAKAGAEKYIRSLPIKSSFYAPAFFMQNFYTSPFLAPRLARDGSKTWELIRANSPETKHRLSMPSGTEASLSERSSPNRKMVYRQVSVGEFKAGLGLPEEVAEVFVDGFGFYEEFGYYGEDGEEKMKWARENTRDLPDGTGLMILEGYLRKYPFKLGAWEPGK
ncbi:NAD(P)-binding protein [Cladorrhinum sp. PSN332]|nr:NAD(P)-binding protein [Cladorrhinum sp. PSN332]